MNSFLYSLTPSLQRGRSWAILAIFAFLTPASSWACVGCRQMTDEVKRTEPSTVMAGFAFSWSVLFMLVVVGLILTFLVTYITRVVQRLSRENELPPQ